MPKPEGKSLFISRSIHIEYWWPFYYNTNFSIMVTFFSMEVIPLSRFCIVVVKFCLWAELEHEILTLKKDHLIVSHLTVILFVC